METNIFTMEIIQQLTKLGFVVKRVYNGHLMTALDYCGFQVSLMNLSINSDLVRLLDAPTKVEAWPCNNFMVIEILIKL